MNLGKRQIFILLALTLTGPIAAHIGSIFLPEGCGSCHVGHGISNEPMLASQQEDFCYQCHGPNENQATMKLSGKLSEGINLHDMEYEFSKPYRHPVELESGHSPEERLPSFGKSATAHAECVDCHNPHQRHQSGSLEISKVSGYSLTGQYLDRAENQYEICLKCHSDESYGISESNSIKDQFSLTSKSMHPVTRPAKNIRQISLATRSGGTGQMQCFDCHTNDNENGPRGPHGSNYRFLLSGNYNIDPEADESPLAYQFCYSCHDRSSILGNESFPLHGPHIEGDPFKNIPGTSCFTCHASHSSESYPYLLKFNPVAVDVVYPGNLREYRSLGINSGECYLMCHGKEHNPARY